jgi:hypothetical protein
MYKCNLLLIKTLIKTLKVPLLHLYIDMTIKGCFILRLIFNKKFLLIAKLITNVEYLLTYNL